MIEFTPVVSIIVPVYNAEKDLHRCIDSIIAQTFTDWELFLIDDGSKDSSGVICDEFATKDNRIRVIHKENGGVSSARNVGLDNARGEWITFVDSDDWIKPQYLEHLFGSIEKSDLVIAYATIYREEEHIGEEEYYPSHVVTEENFSVLFEENALIWHTSPWGKLYRRRLIQNADLKFVENVHIGEDAIFLYSFMLSAKCINVTSWTDYCYYSQMSGSLTKRINSLESERLGLQHITDVITRMKDERKLSEKSIKELNWLKAFYINRVLNALYSQEIPRKERRNLLRELDLDCYVKNIAPDSLRFKLSVNLLKGKHFWSYDTMRHILTVIKRVL